MKSIRNILHIWYHELTTIMHDQGILIFIVITPLIYPLIYASVYTNEVVRNVPAVIVDEINTSTSREFIRKVDATPEIQVHALCHSMAEAEELIKRQEAYGIIRIPSTFDKDMKKGQQTRIGLYCDMCSMLYYKALMVAINNVSLDMNRDIKAERLPSTTNRQEDIIRMPIEYDHVVLYNPQGGYAAFLIPPVLMLIIQQMLLVGIGMAAGDTRERWQGSLVPFHIDYKNPFHIVTGRMLFYFLLFFIWGIYMFTIITPCFGLPQLGSYITLLAFLTPYLLACISFAIVLSTLIYRREDCILLFMFLSVPLLFISGVSWPSAAVPKFWRYVSWIFPSTFGLNGYLRIQNMGATLHDISFEFCGLWVQAGIYYLLACMLYHLQMMRLIGRFDRHKKRRTLLFASNRKCTLS